MKMKRRKFLIALGVVPPLLHACSAKLDLPSAATIITGKVVDIDNKPVEGVGFSFGGEYKKGLSGIPTFDVRVNTNIDGIYKINAVVPQGTESTSFLPEQISFDMIFYVWKNNQYEKVQSQIVPINYGETNTFNFQIRKQ
jgi:hypothetical protein